MVVNAFGLSVHIEKAGAAVNDERTNAAALDHFVEVAGVPFKIQGKSGIGRLWRRRALCWRALQRECQHGRKRDKQSDWRIKCRIFQVSRLAAGCQRERTIRNDEEGTAPSSPPESSSTAILSAAGGRKIKRVLMRHLRHCATALAVALLVSLIATAVFSPPFSVYFTETLAPSFIPS